MDVVIDNNVALTSFTDATANSKWLVIWQQRFNVYC
jgi:hypothetical protein